MIQFNCTHCGVGLTAPHDLGQTTMRCPACGGTVAAPAAAAPADAISALADAASHAPPRVPAGRRVSPPRPNGLAVAALVLGICSLVLPVTVLFLGPLAIVLELACPTIGAFISILALQNAKSARKGKGMALAGLIMCAIPMVLTLAAYIYLKLAVASTSL